jgi:hypothetical protein
MIKELCEPIPSKVEIEKSGENGEWEVDSLRGDPMELLHFRNIDIMILHGGNHGGRLTLRATHIKNSWPG